MSVYFEIRPEHVYDGLETIRIKEAEGPEIVRRLVKNYDKVYSKKDTVRRVLTSPR